MEGDQEWWFCLKHNTVESDDGLSLIHISEPTRP